MGKAIRKKFCWKMEGRMYRIGNAYSCIGSKVYLYLHVELEELATFLDHVYLRCTQRECKPNESMIDEDRKMFESRISAGATEKLRESEKIGANVNSWSNGMKGQAKKCVVSLPLGKQNN